MMAFWGLVAVMELNKERVCEVHGQEEGSVVFIVMGSLNCHQNHLRVEVISQCPQGVVGNLINHRILDLHWSFEHTLENAAHQRVHVLP